MAEYQVTVTAPALNITTIISTSSLAEAVREGMSSGVRMTVSQMKVNVEEIPDPKAASPI